MIEEKPGGGMHMLKGAQKKMIVVRTRDSHLFEEAYFVMRDGGNPANAQRDMLVEAYRLIDGGTPSADKAAPGRKGRRWVGRLLWFLGGLVSGAGVVLAWFHWL